MYRFVTLALLIGVRIADAEDDAPREVAFEPGKGLRVGSADGEFELDVRARIQARAELEHTDKPELTAQIRRLRLVLQGHSFGKRNRFYIQLGFSPRDQLGALAVEDGSIRRTPLRDARIEVERHRDLTIVVGQTKVPFSRQRLISSGSLELPDRAITNEEFNLDRDLGVIVRSDNLGGFGGMLGYAAGVFTGRARNAFEAQPVDLLYVARLDLRPTGAFDDLEEADLGRTKQPRLGLGLAYAFQDDAIADRGGYGELFPDGGTTDYHHVTADAMFKWRGFSAQLAVHLRHGANRRGGDLRDETGELILPPPARSGVGGLVQLGYVFPGRPLQLVTRYAFVRNPYDEDSALWWRDEAGVGIGWYFRKHGYKLQADYLRQFGRDTGPAGASYLDALHGGSDLVRVQLQLVL